MRSRLYDSVEALQTDLDAWLHHYNHERPHLGYRNQGRRPSVNHGAAKAHENVLRLTGFAESGPMARAPSERLKWWPDTGTDWAGRKRTTLTWAGAETKRNPKALLKSMR